MKKKVLTLLAVASVLLITGCYTTNRETGEKVFDPIKTQEVQNAVAPNIATAITIGIAKEPLVKDGVILLHQTLSSLLGKDIIDAGIVNQTLSSLNFNFVGGEDGELWSVIIVNTGLAAYNTAIAVYVTDAVKRDDVLRSLLEGLQLGVEMGLRQNGVAIPE